ncbi:hypothetical protein [Rhizobium sp. RM]|uniref:hypothetical protein n=1 Tax=Rhizobium sp. RM TaxID=2748079 RepID=UPI00110DDE41|nr:hypothetical protein [Rhizobium sp. RM]NWJ24957.1 hypothetical protein [Rhizobium sp. RM]TMV16738.1 hypothetical protein BJG94_20200 [Rhizobium sp. Td3]
MFKISRRHDALAAFPTNQPDMGQSLSNFFISEAWSSDLSSGVIMLGEHACFMHGLPHGECGLLTLIRCYDRSHHAKVLELFEQASTAPSRFCFSTNLLTPAAAQQPVICMGESSGFDEGRHGQISGFFLFPRFENMRFAA